MAQNPKEQKPTRQITPVRPFPPDAPLISLADAADYLRMSPGALRKMLDADTTEMGERLRSWIVSLSPRRRYIQREPLLAWLKSKCGTGKDAAPNIGLDK